jgi:hypothetical protein
MSGKKFRKRVGGLQWEVDNTPADNEEEGKDKK